LKTSFNPAQLADADVAESEQILRKCVHCGFCTATCPTYVLLGDELDSPRGRIYLIKDMLESGRPASGTIVRHIDRCLSCLGCMTTCPSGVHYQHLVDHARTYIERTYRRGWTERVLRAGLAQVLPYPGRLRAALAGATLTRGIAALLPRSVRGLARVLPAPLRAMASLAARSAPRSTAHHSPMTRGAQSGRTCRVALLEGCAQSVLAPATQAAAQRLLERAGFAVVPVKGCCGALVHHLGRAAHARTFARRIMARVAAARAGGALDALVVTASGCGTHLKDYGFIFRADPRLAAEAASMSALTRDITEVLHRQAPLQPALATSVLPGSAAPGLTVAYHSACSLQHGQKIDAVPRLLLERAGFNVKEIPEGHLCCGSAGTYNILQPQLAAQLRERKLANISRTGAHIVATGNIGCIMQLTGTLPVVHTAELLDWAAGGPRPAALAASAASPAGKSHP